MQNDVNKRIRPDASELLLLFATITDELGRYKCVVEVCLFGSLAYNKQDSLSDIDIMVSLRSPSDESAYMVGALAKRIPILCHRPFVNTHPHSGRYWFKDQSPFHKLDLSFHSQDQLKSEVNRLQTLGYTCRTIKGNKLYETNRIEPFTWAYTPLQEMIADNLHRLERIYKRYARSGEGKEELYNELKTVTKALNTSTPTSQEEKAYWKLGTLYKEIVEREVRL